MHSKHIYLDIKGQPKGLFSNVCFHFFHFPLQTTTPRSVRRWRISWGKSCRTGTSRGREPQSRRPPNKSSSMCDSLDLGILTTFVSFVYKLPFPFDLKPSVFFVSFFDKLPIAFDLKKPSGFWPCPFRSWFSFDSWFNAVLSWRLEDWKKSLWRVGTLFSPVLKMLILLINSPFFAKKNRANFLSF